ncbi:GAP family protein [Nocardia sp. XZ_19_369]|uniref:GAP family protein n=1 Tax=Nocardia sp. XZ_19_369 TaxID=2769487 RepID=UPI0018903112|nr:GAP family protein [Nocardia sp. XZ_19_369]
MVTLLLALVGFAVLDSLDVLLVGVTTAVVADSRLARRSPVPGGVSFIAGVFAVTTGFGLCTVLGLNFLSELVAFELTPGVRYWGELVLGVVLIAVSAVPVVRQRGTPAWAGVLRRRPWLFGFVGMAIGLVQAPTAVPYLAGLAMISAQDPLPAFWPLIVVAYCALALLPPLLVLLLSLRRTRRARRVYRTIVRVLTRYAPPALRVLFVTFGAILLINALVNFRHLA